MAPSVEANNNYDKEGLLFEQIALSLSNNYDVKTLITLLKSPIFIEPIAKDFNLSTSGLANSISIDQKANQSGKIADGVLNINLDINNLSKGRLILERLSSSYLDASLKQRQKINWWTWFSQYSSSWNFKKEKWITDKVGCFQRKI